MCRGLAAHSDVQARAHLSGVSRRCLALGACVPESVRNTSRYRTGAPKEKVSR